MNQIRFANQLSGALACPATNRDTTMNLNQQIEDTATQLVPLYAHEEADLHENRWMPSGACTDMVHLIHSENKRSRIIHRNPAPM